MQTKQNPTNPEALLLIRLKRDRAKLAMDQIVKRFGAISHDPDPGLEVLLEYFTNMVYALELLLKVMANDWRTPGESEFGHRVGDMYKEIFGKPHTSPSLMIHLQRAIINQKFILEPAEGLMDHVPDIESLCDELTSEFYKRQWMQDATVKREVFAPAGFVQLLRANLHRFFRSKTYTIEPRISREHRVQMIKHQIMALQKELAGIEAGQEPPEETIMQQMERTQKEFVSSLQGASGCFDFNSHSRNGRFSFGKWSFGKVLPGCLD